MFWCSLFLFPPLLSLSVPLGVSSFHLPSLTCSWLVAGPRRTNAPWRRWRRCWSPCRSPCPRCPLPFCTHSHLEHHGSSISHANVTRTRFLTDFFSSSLQLWFCNWVNLTWTMEDICFLQVQRCFQPSTNSTFQVIQLIKCFFLHSDNLAVTGLYCPSYPMLSFMFTLSWLLIIHIERYNSVTRKDNKLYSKCYL